MTATPVILVGGGGLGPWTWERVVPLLRQRGLAVHTPTLSATGDDPTPATEVTLRTWIDDLADYIARHRLTGAALVAHSFAGYPAAGLLASGTSGVDTAIFVDAALPAPGRSWFDAAGPQTRDFMEGLAADGAVPWFTDDQLDQAYPGHGIDDADRAWMRPRLSAQPIATYTEPAIHSPLPVDAFRAVYVRCTRSPVPPAAIDADTPGWTWRTLDAGHWPMVTAPSALAHTIADLLE
ncbi:alpha/beta fold hydrolase [Glycomyces arizonensis]|uniref:alpha/beta fold hydrolase n=1 Tax=Glycomyces arizonensis TaxID=256035 RepID=UPI00040CC7AC|nr:alpha/beta fold hydrolase [Glycomyces arizonensis]